MTQQQHMFGSMLGGQPLFAAGLPVLPLPLYLPLLPAKATPPAGA